MKYKIIFLFLLLIFTSSVSASPLITSWCNDINGCNHSSLSIVSEQAFNGINFNVTINETVTSVSWKRNGGERKNTSETIFYDELYDIISYNYTVQAFNGNGSSNIISFYVNVTNSIAILTSSVLPTKIFKCGESTISATFNDDEITVVSMILTSEKPVMPMIPGSGRTRVETQTTVVPMTWNGTYWVGTFGDDSNLLWGNRLISFQVTNDIIGTYIISSPSSIFVYSDECTGSGKNSYQNYTHGIGNYTNMLASSDTNIIVWSLYPWIQYWGYLFYVIVIFITVIAIYLKTQNSMHVLFTMLVFLLTIAVLGAIPIEFRSYIIAIIALILGAVFYRLYVRD